MLAQKYPFIAKARKALEGKRITSGELEAAQERVLRVLGKKAQRPAESGEHLATYAAARLLLALSGDNYSARKWAVGEAAAFAEELEKRAGEEEFSEVAHELLPSLQQEDDFFTVAVLDYAKSGRDLAHQEVEGGRVWLDRQAALQLVRRAIEVRAFPSFPSASLKQAPEEMRKAAEQLRAALPKQELPSGVGGRFGGSYLARQCVQELRKGVGEGKRWYASMAIAIALRHDGVQLEQARQAMSEFAANCGKGAQPFTAREALATLEWVYKRESPPRLSCKTLISQGLIEGPCDSCPYRGRFAKTGGMTA